jgi:hypothetical protein
MTKWWTNLIGSIVLISVFSFPVFAADKMIPLEHEGVEGTWMPAPVAKKVLKDVKELRIIRPKMELLKENLQVKEERIIKWREAYVLAVAGEEAAIKGLDDCTALVIESQDEKEVWYKKPVVLIGIGVVFTIVLQVAAVAVFRALEGDSSET